MILSASSCSLLPVPHTDTTHTTQRERRAGLSVGLPLQRSLLQRAGGVWTSARNSRSEEGGRRESGKLTAKNNRDSQVPEGGRSHVTVKGQGLRGSDRQLHRRIASSPPLGSL
ncbi:hypothetical protein PBY51_006650 [Eleginops maclovinus]|uniref:Uncharacterized protein n=1 Tax=Eleginops maclovinus TaxID=56733 RepID=A0AAN7WVH1_ELEMC|nr:hypothetical protein PBY51_006650 [Eleginops maclovinus]